MRMSKLKSWKQMQSLRTKGTGLQRWYVKHVKAFAVLRFFSHFLTGLMIFELNENEKLGF